MHVMDVRALENTLSVEVKATASVEGGYERYSGVVSRRVLEIRSVLYLCHLL
jgi:hypothetical protein